jgi:hypothetical protein
VSAKPDPLDELDAAVSGIVIDGDRVAAAVAAVRRELSAAREVVEAARKATAGGCVRCAPCEHKIDAALARYDAREVSK